MPQGVRIECINKTDRYNPHERIQNVGGRNPSGTRWKMTQPAAIQAIEDGTYRFWVKPPNADSVWVIVARTAQGHKYLKTEADGEEPNNLLSLPECP